MASGRPHFPHRDLDPLDAGGSRDDGLVAVENLFGVKPRLDRERDGVAGFFDELGLAGDEPRMELARLDALAQFLPERAERVSAQARRAGFGVGRRRRSSKTVLIEVRVAPLPGFSRAGFHQKPRQLPGFSREKGGTAAGVSPAAFRIKVTRVGTVARIPRSGFCWRQPPHGVLQIPCRRPCLLASPS